MATRSLNKVMLIGNLTRDPELRYTPQGTAVCSFGLATNRQWTTDTGEKREDAEFHRIVAWSKLAELCAQLLTKGRKVYVEGRLQTRSWQAQDGTQRITTEIVISDMVILDSRRALAEAAGGEAVVAPQVTKEIAPQPEEVVPPVSEEPSTVSQPPTSQPTDKKKKKTAEEVVEKTGEVGKEPPEEINPDDIPF